MIPMHSRPMSHKISSWGNGAATRSRDGISDVAVDGTPASVAVAAPIRTHFGQSPCGASAGIGAPHFGQLFDSRVSLIHPFPETRERQGYRVFSEKQGDFRLCLE